ncbi:MAG: hypothetical protein ACK522_14590 [Synechococcaceae cyanobacterium]|jgi:hypothetical protein
MPPFDRLLRPGGLLGRRTPPPEAGAQPLPLPYSWILTNLLAIGPMPRHPSHWQQLEQAGFRSRFSCCYPNEEQLSPIPDHWRSESVGLPDHREQEDLLAERLNEALDRAEGLLRADAPVYLHCFAGRERSSLMAVGLTARQRGMDVFEALDWVRRCHPAASPIYGHLDVLDQVLRQG